MLVSSSVTLHHIFSLFSYVDLCVWVGMCVSGCVGVWVWLSTRVHENVRGQPVGVCSLPLLCRSEKQTQVIRLKITNTLSC